MSELLVLEKKIATVGGKLVVPIFGRTPDAVISVDSKRLAIDVALRLGHGKLGFSSHSGAYAVEDGFDAPEDPVKAAKDRTIIGYRNDIELMGSPF